MSRDDRTVHARYPGMEIVRYDAAGKWWVEPTDPAVKRRMVSVAEAASMARAMSAEVFVGRPGGKMFEAKVREV